MGIASRMLRAQYLRNWNRLYKTCSICGRSFYRKHPKKVTYDVHMRLNHPEPKVLKFGEPVVRILEI